MDEQQGDAAQTDRTKICLIVGAQRAATTSMYKYLSQHPLVEHPTRKEIHYFDTGWFSQPISWYLNHWPIQDRIDAHVYHELNRKVKHVGQPKILLDASPCYILHPLAAERAANVMKEIGCFQNVRIIAILRNPIDRAWSQYWHEVRQGHEKLSAKEALLDPNTETVRLKDENEKKIAPEAYYSYNLFHCSYRARGRYLEQLERWWSNFPPANTLIVDYDLFVGDPSWMMPQIFNFLGLDDFILKTYNQFNKGLYQRNLDCNERESLAEYFHPYNIQLQERLGVDFKWT